jgi:lauroyl/myristoyl acyltransferase
VKSWQSAALWVVINAVGLFVSLLPRRLELFLGHALGRGLLGLGGSRVRVARENLVHCYPSMDEGGRESLLRRQFEHLGILALELLHLFSPIPGHYRRYLARIGRLEGMGNWRAR